MRTKPNHAWDEQVHQRDTEFFFLCETHRNLIQRPEDGIKKTAFSRLVNCDAPKCKHQAEYEFFPNLYPVR